MSRGVLGSRRSAGEALDVVPAFAAELDFDLVALAEEQEAEAHLEARLPDQLVTFQRQARRRLAELALLPRVQGHALHLDLPLALGFQVIRAGGVDRSAGLERLVLQLAVDQDRS